MAAQIGAALQECAEGRVVHRNGYRERDSHTRVGSLSLSLAIPKMRARTYFASFLDP